MTVKDDALSRAVTFDVTGEIDPLSRGLHRALEARCDCPYPNATLDAVDEVQTVTAGDRTGGDMDLDFTLADGQTFSVDAVAFDEAAVDVQTALDAAAGAAVTNYVAGDIVVAGGPFGSGGSSTTFTFSGSSVRGDHPLLVVDGTNLTGGTTDPAPSETNAGVVPRFWFAALKNLGVLVGTDPAFGATPAGQYTVNLHDSLENYPSTEVIKMLIREATVQEGQDWESELLPLLGL